MTEEIINTVKGYAYNAYEVCRILNGFNPQDFRPCFHNRRELSDRCRAKTRRCKTRSRQIDKIMRKLWKEKKLKSIKLRWFDKGRAKNGNLCTDLFRFYFLEKKGLANRLKTDIKNHLEN